MRKLGYETLKYGHYTGKAVQTRHPKTFSCSAKPSENVISNDTDGAKYWWQAKCKEMMAEKITYTYNIRKMSPTVLGCCNKDL